MERKLESRREVFGGRSSGEGWGAEWIMAAMSVIMIDMHEMS